MPSHKEMWDQVPEDADLVVIGGGITGAGIGRDAARRGLRVVLFEQNDIAYGTSSRSSKLIHGGLRYLETYEFSLVFESVSERRVVMDLAPHLVNPMPFLFPVYQGSRKSLRMISAGMWLYDGLALFRSPKRHRTLNPTEVAAEEPLLKQEGLQGAPVYYDCSTDDARLTLETIIDATRNGAVVATWARVDALIKDDHGRVSGVVVKNRTGRERSRGEGAYGDQRDRAVDGRSLRDERSEEGQGAPADQGYSHRRRPEEACGGARGRTVPPHGQARSVRAALGRPHVRGHDRHRLRRGARRRGGNARGCRLSDRSVELLFSDQADQSRRRDHHLGRACGH